MKCNLRRARLGLAGRLGLLVLVVLLAAGCGGSEVTPTPSPMATPEPTPTPTFGPTGVISGRVYKDEDGDGRFDPARDIAIVGATVGAWIDDGLVAVGHTDETGEYEMYAPSRPGYVLDVSLPSRVRCYDPELETWGYWSTVEGRREGVKCPAYHQDIAVRYSMLNYGPGDFSWELWHAGPIWGRPNVVLVHGAQISVIPWIAQAGDGKTRGRHDDEFTDLDELLQSKRYGQYDVWEFEYADVGSYGKYWTHGSIAVYGDRLGTATRLIRGLSSPEVSVVAHSMGGLVSRYAAQYLGNIQKVLTLATAHFGFEYTPLVGSLARYPCLIEMQPGSSFLWALNTAFRHGDFEMASIAAMEDAPAVSPLLGIVRYSSASVVECNYDGNATYDPEHTYFTIVPGTHQSIKDFSLRADDKNKDDDFVFEGIRAFLETGVSDQLRAWSDQDYPADQATRPYFSFRFSNPVAQGYPRVVVGGRLISRFETLSAEGGRLIWTINARADDQGLVSIEYAAGRYAYGWLPPGQSSMMKRVINN